MSRCSEESQHDRPYKKKKKKKFKKKKEKWHMPHHRRWFDSVICSLSPPTFTRCRTTSRMRVLQIAHSVPKFDLKHFERVNIFFFLPSTLRWHCTRSVSTYSFSAASFLSDGEHHVTCLAKKEGVLGNLIATLMASRDKRLSFCHCLYSERVCLSQFITLQIKAGLQVSVMWDE